MVIIMTITMNNFILYIFKPYKLLNYFLIYYLFTTNFDYNYVTIFLYYTYQFLAYSSMMLRNYTNNLNKVQQFLFV